MMDDPFIKLRKDTLTKIHNNGESYCRRLEKLWIKMFDNDSVPVSDRYQTIEAHINDLFEAMVNEETETYNDYRVETENLLAEAELLRNELNITINFPFEVDVDSVNLHMQCKNLRSYLTDYRKMKEDRLSMLRQYRDEEQRLCDKLGEITKYSTFEAVPSEETLSQMKQRIITLNSEKVSRQKSLTTLVREIKELLKELEITKVTDSDNEKALKAPEDFVLSENNLFKLEECKAQLINDVEIQTKLIIELKEKVMILWNRLDICGEEREKILMKTSKPCGKSVLETWQKELDRCQELKKKNIQDVILRCRDVIRGLWEDCHMTDSEREQFTDYFSEDYNEYLLESHEKEEEKLRAFYEESREIFVLAEKWFGLWNKMLSLEERSTNSQRLNNRGGQLLKEERERKVIQKELSKVESKLEKLIEAFEVNHQKPFLYDGQALMDIISMYWENRRIEKENEKEVRKIQNLTRQQVTPLKSNSRMATPVKNPSSRKRGRPLTPVENIMPRKTTARRELKMPTVTKKEVTRGRRSKSADPVPRYGSQRTLRSTSANSSVVSYNGFQNYIESKSKLGSAQGMSLRSSLSPSRYGLGNSGPKTNSIVFKTPTSTVKSAGSSVKRTRLNPPSRICRPMIT